MITRNLHNYFIAHLTTVNSTVTTRSGGTTTVNPSSSTWFQYNAEISTSLTDYNNSRYARTLRIGSGTTEPTHNDYELESMIEVAPRNITTTRSGGYQTSYDILTAIFINETDSDWTVTEVGQYLATSNSDASAAILLAREVFDPVTVKPGQTFSVSMKLF